MLRRPLPSRTAAAAPVVAAAVLLVALTSCRPLGLAAAEPMTGPTAGPTAATAPPAPGNPSASREPPSPSAACPTATASRTARPTKAAVPIAFPAADRDTTCSAAGVAPCPPGPAAVAPTGPPTSAKPAPAPATPRRLTPLTALPTAPPYVRPVGDDDVPAARCGPGAPQPTGTPR